MPHAVHGSLSLCSVLIVDDDQPLVGIYAKILAHEKRCIATAFSHLEALVWLKSHPLPDILLLDCRMGEMTNEEFKQALDNVIGDSKKPRVIGFSSFSGTSPHAAEMKSLFGEFIEKPDDLEHLIDVIEKLCEEVHGANP